MTPLCFQPLTPPTQRIMHRESNATQQVCLFTRVFMFNSVKTTQGNKSTFLVSLIKVKMLSGCGCFKTYRTQKLYFIFVRYFLTFYGQKQLIEKNKTDSQIIKIIISSSFSFYGCKHKFVIDRLFD